MVFSYTWDASESLHSTVNALVEQAKPCTNIRVECSLSPLTALSGLGAWAQGQFLVQLPVLVPERCVQSIVRKSYEKQWLLHLFVFIFSSHLWGTVQLGQCLAMCLANSRPDALISTSGSICYLPYCQIGWWCRAADGHGSTCLVLWDLSEGFMPCLPWFTLASQELFPDRAAHSCCSLVIAF